MTMPSRGRIEDQSSPRSNTSEVRGGSPVLSSSSESVAIVIVQSNFPKKWKIRVFARLVSKKEVSDLGYPFDEEARHPIFSYFKSLHVSRIISL
jgi:hypothetical protein